MTAGIHRQRPGAESLEAAHADGATQIAEGLWMSPGLSNSYLLTTDAGRVVVNTGMGFEGPVHRALFDEVSPAPVRMVVITQGHFDHVGGIDHFLEPDGSTEVVAAAGWRTWRDDNERLAKFRADRAAFAFLPKVLRGMQHVAGRFPDADTSQGEIAPTVEVAERRIFRVGELTFELIPVRGGETTDSLVMWLPERRICLTGNTFGPLFAHVPNLVTLRGDRYRDPLDVLDTIETVRSLGAETLVTGHFDPVVGADLIDRELAHLHAAVKHVHDETVAGMNAGVDVHTLMRTIRVPDGLDVGEGYGLTRWNVRAIWENYAGWFHARSTTELYATPFAAVHGDLVELIGADGLAEAARRRLAAGEPVEAIHLAEIAAADSTEAVRVVIEAHQQLLVQASNFWERSWLERQIDRLTARLARAHDEETLS